MVGRRFARIAGLGIGTLALLTAGGWLAGCALVESGILLEWVNRRPEKLRVEYASVHSPWPGRLVLEGFSIRGQTKKVQWLATADRIAGDVSVLPLVVRRFVASDVAAEGVAFRLRRRADAFAQMEVPGEQMPPIGGLANPPRPPPEELYPLREDRWRWTVALHDWRLDDVREIWLDQYRYRGTAAVDGGYTVRIKRTTRVRPTRFTLRRGALHVGREAVATGVEGSLQLASERFHHRRVRGADAIPFFDTRIDVAADVRDVRFLNLYLDELPWIAFDGGAGRLEASVRARDGRFRPGSHIRFRPHPVAVRLLDYRVSGSGDVAWSAVADDGGGTRLATRFDAFRIQRLGYETPHVRGRGLAVTLTSPDLDVPPDLRRARVVAELPEAEVPDFAFYQAYVPDGAGLSDLSGTGTVAGRVELRAADASGSGWIDLRGRDLRVRYGEGTIAGDLAVSSRLPDIDLEARRFDLAGTTVDIERGRIVKGGAGGGDETPWGLAATLESGTLRPGEPVTLAAAASVRMTDSRPLVGLFVLRETVPAWLQGALRVEGVRGEARLRIGDGLVALDHFRAAGEKVEARGRLRLADNRRRGVLMLTYRGLDLGVLLRDGETDYKLTDVGQWYERTLRQREE